MKPAIFVFFVCFSGLCWTQEAKKETLKSALSKAKKIEEKIDLLMKLSKLENFDGNLSYKKRALRLTEINGITPRTEEITNRISDLLNTALEYRDNVRFCLPYYKKFNSPKFNYGRMNMAFHLGFSYENLGKTDSMFYYYTKAIQLANENSVRERRMKSRALRNRGYAYLKQAEYIKAIRDLEASLEVMDQNDFSNQAGIRLVLFNVYNDLEDRKKAIVELNLAAKAAKKDGGFMMLANTEYFYATYYLKENPQKALRHGLKGLCIYEKHNYPYGIVFMKNILAEVYVELRDFEQATKANQYIIDHAVDLGVYENAAIAQKNLGQIALVQKNYPLALTYCDKAWLFFKESRAFLQKKEVCACLFEAYKGKGNTQQSVAFLEKSIVFADSLRNENAVREIYNTQKNIAIERQKSAFKTARLKRELKTAKEIEQQQLITGIIGAVAIIILLVFLFYYRISNERKKAAELLAGEKHYLDNLLHNLVHEFRTPLTLIKGPAEELLKEDSGNSHFQMINRNSDHLLGLVNQVLDFAKIKSGKWSVASDETNLQLFLSDSVDLFAKHAAQKNICLLKSWNGLPLVKTDSDKLFKIISNLLSNAIKYSGSNTEITIRCEVTYQQLHITVEDQGIGMSEEDQKKVFDKFYQVDSSTTRKGEGTGIGLAFTKELVRLLGGKIVLKSALHKGTTICVTIPVEQVGENELQTVVQSDPETFRNPEMIETDAEAEERPKILIIEDNEDLRVFLAQILGKNGCELLTAENGQKGIDLALEQVPDLIISDVMMPEKDGYQVVQELKASPVTEHIPILILTAKVSFDSMITGLNAGADDYLSKPFNATELLLRVNNQLERQEKLRQKYLAGGNASELSTMPQHPLLVKIEALMAVDFSKQFSAEELAVKCALSRSQLHRKIKSLTGLSATGFMTRIRLNHALAELKNPDLTIAEISYRFGYADPANFSRIFKKHFGKTPTEAREASN
jgi:signal transduction histidine kinase/DNA-binding response OmpR family regulator